MARYITYRNDFGFVVEETATAQLVARTSNVEEAASLKARLNTGTGFGGDTPSFFTSPLLDLDRTFKPEESVYED